MLVETFTHYINGRFVPAASGESLFEPAGLSRYARGVEPRFQLDRDVAVEFACFLPENGALSHGEVTNEK